MAEGTWVLNLVARKNFNPMISSFQEMPCFTKIWYIIETLLVEVAIN